jgi:hypothetical protein
MGLFPKMNAYGFVWESGGLIINNEMAVFNG